MSKAQELHQLQQIKLKVLKVLQENEALKTQVQRLNNEMDSLVQLTRQQKNTIESLQTQNKIVKLAERMSFDAESNQELKKLIQDYVRQLDDCIRLLSE
ncbi:MAG: hypothetical protein ACK5UI_07955 [Bacteroidota bacterium]|jgi:hypothetical protein